MDLPPLRLMIGHVMEDTPLLALIITLHLLIGTAAIVCNLPVWSFYRTKHDNITHFLYLILAGVDMASGVAPLLHAGLLIAILQDSDSSVKVLLPTVYFLTSITSRLSVFLATVIAVIRTLNIALPFYFVKKTLILIAFFLYMVWWLVFLSGDMVDYKDKSGDVIGISLFVLFYLAIPTPGFYFADMIWTGLGITLFVNHQQYQHFIYNGIPFGIPIVVCIVCMCIQVWNLVIKKKSGASQNNDINKQITITIYLLTTVFVVCNILFIIIFFGTVISNQATEGQLTKADFYLSYFAVNMLPSINSAINPIILIIRGRSLNQYVRGIATRLMGCSGLINSKVSGTTPQTETIAAAKSRGTEK